ncbi:MAG: NAD(P)H-quinone oxidoreductase subunit N [Thermostichus sp. DG_1_6_bins_120]
MLLVGSGEKFVRQLEQSGALAIFVTPEGGSEGHYLRRLRGAGYQVVTLSSKGIGDLASYLTRIHGVRPAILGKSERRTYFFPPLIEQYRATLPPQAKGLVFWFYEGHVLSQQELSYLVKLSQEDKGVKFVVELGRDQAIRWQPLQSA